MEAWKVHKFGGSSVADAACMERVAQIIEGDPALRKAVVLSACRGVTDALLNLQADGSRSLAAAMSVTATNGSTLNLSIDLTGIDAV